MRHFVVKLNETEMKTILHVLARIIGNSILYGVYKAEEKLIADAQELYVKLKSIYDV